MTDTFPQKKILTVEQALIRIQKYCAYQERSQQEVRNRLYQWGLRSHEIESMIVDLIQENFLKEERFATAFTGGKFRQKKWGRGKIKMALQEKRVSPPLIKKALSEISEKDYIKTLKDVIRMREKLVAAACKQITVARFPLISQRSGPLTAFPLWGSLFSH